MILFENYYMLGFIPVLLGVWLVLFHHQRGALEWIERNVSPRFRARFTAYGRLSMPLHLSLLLFMGILIVLACAGPYISGNVEQKTRSGDVVLILDASLSMLAKDSDSVKGSRVSRLRAARERALGIMDAFPNHRFGLMSFSGLTVIHAPLTRDHYGVRDALGSLTAHGYQRTGSSLRGALTRLLSLSTDTERSVQAILFSDGELPRPEKYGDELSALAAKKIRVHAMALGSPGGVRLKLFDPELVRKRISVRKVVKTVTTRRIDKHLSRIASRTDGEFTKGKYAKDLQSIKKALEKGSRSGVSVLARGKKDLSLRFLAAFLILFLLEMFALEPFLGRWARSKAALSGPARQSASRLMVLFIVCAPLFLTGCEIAAWKAHALNEKGLAKQSLTKYDSARPDFERSAAYQVKEEVPTYNQANGRLKQGQFKKAHKVYERAMQMRPDLAPAYYNDGVALYRWGGKELDVKQCRLKRTKRLWKSALGRFRKTMRLNYEQERDGKLGDKARLNADHVRDQLEELAKLEKKCAAQKKNQKKQDQDKTKKDDKSKKNQSKNRKKKPDNKNKGQDPKKKTDQGKNEKKPARPRMGEKEKKKVQSALKRIRRERRGKKFQQSKQQQLRRGKPGNKKGPGGSPLLW